MPGSSVEVRGVSRKFDLGSEEVWAVKDVTLSVAAGEFVALIGRSGSGKTTLLNLVAALDRPTTGEVRIDDVRVDTLAEHDLNELRRHKLGFVFQSFGLLPLLSAEENIDLPLRIAGVKRGDRLRRTRRVLDMVGLGRRASHRPYELSGGEQQRVAIARALATEPTLMLADEPTGELDSATATAIFGLLKAVARQEGITVLTCTHDRLIMDLADRIEELADGRLLREDERHVWHHVTAREASPFTAHRGTAEEPAPALSSLVGADITQFRPLHTEEAPTVRPPYAEPEEEPEEELGRWARPHD